MSYVSCQNRGYRLQLTGRIPTFKDGVLTHGPQTIPAAKRALAFLEGDNPTGG